MESFFNNAWVINIGTGLITSAVWALVNKIVLNIVFNKEEDENINRANKEIIRILKPYVVESDMLNREIIIAVTNSVARKYKCSSSKLDNVIDVCETLITEVLEASYVNNENKRNYIDTLTKIINSTLTIELKNKAEMSYEYTQKNSYKNQTIYRILSLIMITFVLTFSVIITFTSKYSGSGYANRSKLILIVCFIYNIILLFFLFIKFYRKKIIINFLRKIDKNK